MRGDGTNRASTSAEMTQARLLDLTRSLRRAGRVATGVDRVERAYLEHFVGDDAPAFGLLRSAFGYILLDRAGMRAFLEALTGQAPWGQAGVLSRLPRGRNEALTQAETHVRGRAVARCLPGGLRRMLARQLPDGFSYYNVGHSNLTERVLRSVGYAGGHISVLIHDVIPLEYPGYQRPGTVRPFRDKLRRVQRMADRVIYNSADTQQRTEAQMMEWGPVPGGIVAHLGTIAAAPDHSTLAPGVMPAHPYFVTVGTIEPRKNHAFLLDLWEEMGADAPPLLICGSRGWNNEAVFARLDALPPDGPVREIANLNDPALAALVGGSAGALFPSHAEGYGLPPVEALEWGTRVLCNDLTVLREILGSYGTFAPVSDGQLWLKTIKSWEKTSSNAGNRATFAGPKWADHFKTVLRLR